MTTTLRDLVNLNTEVKAMICFFGCTANFEAEFTRRCRYVGDAICGDFNSPGVWIGAMDVKALPPETHLGPRAEEAFLELKKWLETQHPDFKAKPTA